MTDVLSRLDAIEDHGTKIKAIEKELAALSSKLDGYPDASEFDSYITWPVLEEALSQHMKKMEDLQKAKVSHKIYLSVQYVENLQHKT